VATTLEIIDNLSVTWHAGRMVDLASWPRDRAKQALDRNGSRSKIGLVEEPFRYKRPDHRAQGKPDFRKAETTVGRPQRERTI
jgi:hypothetical protein